MVRWGGCLSSAVPEPRQFDVETSQHQRAQARPTVAPADARLGMFDFRRLTPAEGSARGAASRGAALVHPLAQDNDRSDQSAINRRSRCHLVTKPSSQES
jgi:hypothetical protein